MTEQQKLLQEAKDAVAKIIGYKDFAEYHKFWESKSCIPNQSISEQFMNDVAIKYNELCEVDKWISVDEIDKLPKMYQGVLVYLSNGFITIAYRKDTATHYAWQLFGDNDLLNVNSEVKIIKWQPLPQPPK